MSNEHVNLALQSSASQNFFYIKYLPSSHFMHAHVFQINICRSISWCHVKYPKLTVSGCEVSVPICPSLKCSLANNLFMHGFHRYRLAVVDLVLQVTNVLVK